MFRKVLKSIIFSAVCCLSFLSVCDLCPAAILTVPNQYGTIQGAINAASNGDIIVVFNGSYGGNINYNGKAITVRSLNGAAFTSIVGTGSTSVVSFVNGEGSSSRLRGFTITNGIGTTYNNEQYGGGIICSGSSPLINLCHITDNSATKGGGIACVSDSAPNIDNNNIYDNTATISGGGIYAYDNLEVEAAFEIENNDIYENTTTGDSSCGGGIACMESSQYIRDNHIYDNSTDTDGDGGGIYCSDGTSYIDTNLIEDNSTGYGGGVAINDGGHLLANQINGNSAYIEGGGVYCWDANPDFMNNVIWYNTVADYSGCGAGISLSACSPDITNNTIVYNQATGNQSYGGGIYLSGSSSPVTTNNIWWYNTANTGNQVANNGTGTIYLNHSCFQTGAAHIWGLTSQSYSINPGAGPGMVSSTNFHLGSGAACLDCGNNAAPSIPYWDIDGQLRIRNTTVDMGADEY